MRTFVELNECDELCILTKEYDVTGTVFDTSENVAAYEDGSATWLLMIHSASELSIEEVEAFANDLNLVHHGAYKQGTSEQIGDAIDNYVQLMFDNLTDDNLMSHTSEHAKLYELMY